MTTNHEYDDTAVILDNGSGYMKCGFVGENEPRVVFPTTVGRPRHRGVMVGMGRKDAYVGDEALAKRGILSLKNPIEYGTVINWDDLEKIWHHSFYNELRVPPEEHNLFLTDKIPNSPKINREKMTQIAFETFNVPGFYIEYQSLLSLYATGKQTAVIIDTGYNVTYSIPIYEHKIIDEAVQFTDIGGVHITEYLKRVLLLSDRQDFKTMNNNKILGNVMASTIKHKFCYAKTSALEDKILGNFLISGYMRNYADFEPIDNMNNISDDILDLCYSFFDSTEEFLLPDGTKITLNNYERNECVEGIFNPLLLVGDKQKKEVSIPRLICDTLLKCDEIYRKDLCENIIVCGGNSMFDHFDLRLSKELNDLKKLNESLQNATFNVERWTPVTGNVASRYSAWVGASILGSLASFNEFWITKNDYDETGPSIVDRCFVHFS